MAVLDHPLVWSKSQVSAFRECVRKGFFSSPSNDVILNGKAQELKKLKNRFLWTGAVIHDTIGTVVKQIRQGQPLMAPEEVIEQVRQRMRQDFRSSQTANTPEGRLFEHQYQLSLSKEIWQSQWNQVEKSLRWFMSSSWLSRLTSMGPECWKAVDEVLSFDVDGIKAYVKVDCALEVEGRIILIDWKTSALKTDDAAPLQVAALYAHEVWGADPENIAAHAVSLTEGRSSQIPIDEDVLMETFLRIQEESAFLEEQKQRSDGNPFALPAASQQTCERCNFRQLCHPNGL